MAATVGSAQSMAMRRGRLLQQLVLFCAMAGLGAAAAAGIVKATDGGVQTVRESKIILVPHKDYPDYSIYLVRDMDQALWLEGQLALSIDAQADSPGYRILIAGTPEEDAVAQERIQRDREAGGNFELSDLRSHFAGAVTPGR